MLDEQHLLDDLTEPQREAATHVDGPLLIVAGAGSGKTRVITRRVAYLISQGIPPNSILAITFTNKAAGEMKHRVSSVLGTPIHDFGKLDQRWPTICTFHSLCLRILRQYAEVVGLAPNFSIFDSSDQSRVIKEALKTLEISADHFAPSMAHHAISQAKNKLITPEAYAQTAGDFHERTTARVYTKYQSLLNQYNALDFDDLMLRTTAAFRDHPKILHELQERFTYLMIDEYQDTNHAQYILAHALALKHRNICVVGDPDQSIYAWRGADIKNILAFETDYPDAKVVRLEQNYRSTKTILHIASALIANNSQRKKKDLWTENDSGERARLIFCSDEYDEAQTITAELQRLNDQGYSWNQMAIFYRMNSLSRVMEKSLFSAQVPYQIARGVEFYGRKEIKDVLAYLRVIANPSDEVSLERIVNVPTRGIGDAAVQHLQASALSNGFPLFSAMEQVASVPGVSARAANSIKLFVKMIKGLRDQQAGPVKKIMEDVIEQSGMEKALRKLGGDELQELANVNELITAAAEYDTQNPEGSLLDYLAQVSLVSDVDRLKDAGGSITLMTLHAAKGLEFPVVAIMGLEEGCLPHARAKDNPDDLEEERRLCFVGITRAQERLILTSAAVRTVRGMRAPTLKSPFLREMPREALDVIEKSAPSFRSPFVRRDESYDSQEPPTSQFREGQMVRHAKFGVGKIMQITEMGTNTRAEVDFRVAGKKTLILEYAKLQPVG